jgi:DNA-directed RNA polymerase specialized sigma24 family protein
MAWDDVDLHTNCGNPLPETDRETILDVVNKSLLQDRDRDPNRVIQAATRVARRIHRIANVRAYAIHSIFRAGKKDKIAQAKGYAKEDELTSLGDVGFLLDCSQPDKIENRILIRELLETRSPQDREIFLRRMAGETFPEIDGEMHLKPGTAATRFKTCKKDMRKVLNEKLDRMTSTRAS